MLATLSALEDCTQLTPAPLKLFALERDLEHHDVPATGLSFPSEFGKHHPSNLLLTASFGHIIPTPLLEPFAHSLNVHPSALPLYRGAAPVQWAIANRDESTGVTVQSMAPREVGVDAGAILGAVDGLVSGSRMFPGSSYLTRLADQRYLARSPSYPSADASQFPEGRHTTPSSRTSRTSQAGSWSKSCDNYRLAPRLLGPKIQQL